MKIAQFHQCFTYQMPELNTDELAELTAAFTLCKVKKRPFSHYAVILRSHTGQMRLLD